MYKFFQSLLGASKARKIYVQKYVRPKDGDSVLDIGCGPADILEYLPNVIYVGFDMNQKYISTAIKRFGNRGKFICNKIQKERIKELSAFDIILANGVLHHLNNEKTQELFELARAVMKPNGRLITIDPCYVNGQSQLARYLISSDRGKYIKTKAKYIEFATLKFTNVRYTVTHDLLRIPYTHGIFQRV